MPTFALFRFSTYLSLALAFVVLAYAEWIFVPEATVIMLLMIASLVVLYFNEDRISLSLRGANLVGGVVGLIASAWLIWHLAHTGTGLLENLPWSVRIMPYIGPVLAVLIPVKILRPHKHVGDYWALQAGAVCLVALATAMAEDGLFFSIVLLYLLAVVWSLVLFFLMRSSGRIAPIPARHKEPPPLTHETGRVAHPRRQEVKCVAKTFLASLAIATPFFLLTPRTGGPVWDLAGRHLEVGFAADQLLDLNRTGTLHPNTDAAFEVEVTDPVTGQPVLALPTEMRWRSLHGSYTTYSRGTWKREDVSARGLTIRNPTAPENAQPGPWKPPTFGPGTVRVQFSVPSRLRALFLADPIRWDRDASAPVAWIQSDGALPWTIRPDGQVVPISLNRLQRFVSTYVQMVRPEAGIQTGPLLIPPWKSTAPLFDLGPDFDLQNGEELSRQLRENPVAAIKEYTDRLVERLMATGKLRARAQQDYDANTGFLQEQFHTEVASALRDHLRNSGQFVYSYRLRKQDARLDPIEDFLKNTREGHCERFATALALMLRSQGIRAQFVMGFKGQEAMENGRFVIRHDNAHAWVEVLVPALDDPTGRTYHWLSLDPTPGLDEVNATRANSWWESTLLRSQEILSVYVVGYDANSREQLMADVLVQATWGNLTALVAITAVCVLLIRMYRRSRRWALLNESKGWKASYTKLLVALGPLGLTPGPGQTLREFAITAEGKLRESAHTLGVASVPIDWAEAHYADHFGGQSITPSRAAELDLAVESLRRAVKQGG